MLFVTNLQLHQFFESYGHSGQFTFQEWVADHVEEDPLLDEATFNALRKCDLNLVCCDRDMSENHPGGDDICAFVDAALKAKDGGYEVAVWYGDHAEVLILGYRPGELTITS